MSTKIVRRKELGHFQNLLLRACPPAIKDEKTARYRPVKDGENGVKSIAALASMLGISPWGVQLWIKKSVIPPGRAAQIVDLNPAEVSLHDFSPYIYGQALSKSL